MATCSMCSKSIPAEEMAEKCDLVPILGIAGSGKGPVSEMVRALAAATRAWKCGTCGEWICNSCVCRTLTSSGAGQIGHANCGGVFRAPATNSTECIEKSSHQIRRVTVSRFGISVPQMCACCGAIDAYHLGQVWSDNSNSKAELSFPYCLACINHQKAKTKRSRDIPDSSLCSLAQHPVILKSDDDASVTLEFSNTLYAGAFLAANKQNIQQLTAKRMVESFNMLDLSLGLLMGWTLALILFAILLGIGVYVNPDNVPVQTLLESRFLPLLPGLLAASIGFAVAHVRSSKASGTTVSGVAGTIGYMFLGLFPIPGIMYVLCLAFIVQGCRVLGLRDALRTTAWWVVNASLTIAIFLST